MLVPPSPKKMDPSPVLLWTNNLPLALISPEAVMSLNKGLSVVCNPKSTSLFIPFIVALWVPCEGEEKLDADIVPVATGWFTWNSCSPSFHDILVPATLSKILLKLVLNVCFPSTDPDCITIK